MANMILVDYDTAINPESHKVTKNAVIEAVVGNPEWLITVLNSNHTMTLNETKAALRDAQFPFDTAIVNPLPARVPPLAYKTMFAAKLQEDDQHTPVLILDADPEAMQMWRDAIPEAVRKDG